MDPKTRTQPKALERMPTGFQNRRFRAQVGRTTAGSPVLVIERIAMNRSGRFDGHRQMAAFIYELAADMPEFENGP